VKKKLTKKEVISKAVGWAGDKTGINNIVGGAKDITNARKENKAILD
jgi:hypothetical protein